MSGAGLKPAIPAIERPQNYTSDGRATGIGSVVQLAGSIAFILAVEDTGNIHHADADKCQDVT
jgi:hypothetical protein